MKKIGLIGGITPESTILYYQILNSLNANKLGESHSAELVIHTLDFGQISKLTKLERWDLLDIIMADAGEKLEKAGATCIVISANTMHLCIDAVRNAVSIPVIHIAEVTSIEITKKELKKVALLGTKYTMEKDFFKNILTSFGIETIIPNNDDRYIINEIIYNELAKGKITKIAKKKYLEIISKLVDQGAEGIILGCTEIPLLVKQKEVTVPVFDTTTIHATAAFLFSNQ
tara:strand:+ start:153 stop:842 length:690 start_codon:yes stop_codon:yes gene_type:complete